jgi:hypothetical protein
VGSCGSIVRASKAEDGYYCKQHLLLKRLYMVPDFKLLYLASREPSEAFLGQKFIPPESLLVTTNSL